MYDSTNVQTINMHPDQIHWLLQLASNLYLLCKILLKHWFTCWVLRGSVMYLLRDPFKRQCKFLHSSLMVIHQ